MASYDSDGERNSSVLRLRRYLDRFESLQTDSDREDQRALFVKASELKSAERDSISRRHWQMLAGNGKGSSQEDIFRPENKYIPHVTCIRVNPDIDSIHAAPKGVMPYYTPDNFERVSMDAPLPSQLLPKKVEYYMEEANSPSVLRNYELTNSSEGRTMTQQTDNAGMGEMVNFNAAQYCKSAGERPQDSNGESECLKWSTQPSLEEAADNASHCVPDGQVDTSVYKGAEKSNGHPTKPKSIAQKGLFSRSNAAPPINIGRRTDDQWPAPIRTASVRSTGSNLTDVSDTVPKPYSHALTVIRVKPVQAKNQSQQRAAAAEKPLPITSCDHEGSSTWCILPLLRRLYKIESCNEYLKAHLDHLPLGQEHDHSDPAWTEHYFVLAHGCLEWFQDESESHRLGQLNLLNAEITWDPLTSFVKIKCPANGADLVLKLSKGMMGWLPALRWQSREHLLMPLLPTSSHSEKKICVIEIGSCSTRVGLVQNKLTLPHLFFPSVLVETTDGTLLIGEEAAAALAQNPGNLSEHMWFGATLFCSDRLSLDKVTQVFRAIFRRMDIHPPSFQLLLSLPLVVSRSRVIDILRLLLEEFQFKGVAIERQANLALIALDAKTGVVVDMGNKLSIVAIYDGYEMTNTIVSLQSYATEMNRVLRNKLCNKGYGFGFDAYKEENLLRYVKENACFVSSDFAGDLSRSFHSGGQEFLTDINLGSVDPESCLPYESIEVSQERFEATEILFSPKRWGLDSKGLHELVSQCIRSSPIDNRRELFKSIYLVGGTSLFPGLPERLESELRRMVPSSVEVNVHVAPWRYHASFLGAKIVGDTNLTQKILITRNNMDSLISQSFLDLSVI